jgi:hypothetical protein
MNKARKIIAGAALALTIGGVGAIATDVESAEAATSATRYVNCPGGYEAAIKVSNIFGNQSNVTVYMYNQVTGAYLGSATVRPGEVRNVISNGPYARFYMYTAGGGFGHSGWCA